MVNGVEWHTSNTRYRRTGTTVRDDSRLLQEALPSTRRHVEASCVDVHECGWSCVDDAQSWCRQNDSLSRLSLNEHALLAFSGATPTAHHLAWGFSGKLWCKKLAGPGQGHYTEIYPNNKLGSGLEKSRCSAKLAGLGHRLKTDASFVATEVAGKWSDRSVGSRTIADLSLATNTTLISSTDLLSLLA